MPVFAHLAEGVIPSTPGLCGRTNDQVVVAGFQFDFVVEPVLFQEDFRYAYATRVANPNQSKIRQEAFSWQASVLAKCPTPNFAKQCIYMKK